MSRLSADCARRALRSRRNRMTEVCPAGSRSVTCDDSVSRMASRTAGGRKRTLGSVRSARRTLKDPSINALFGWRMRSEPSSDLKSSSP